jgi:ABC-type branched-subunit amino acid transport system ATPase component
LAVVTLGIAVATESFIFSNPSFIPLTGNLIPDPTLAGLNLGVLGDGATIRARFGFLALAVLLLVAVGVANLARGATGRRFLAVRSNERAAAASGVSPASTKLLAFALSSFVAGIGGAMLGYSRGQLSGASFDAFSGISLLVFAYLGGITSITGALIGGLLAPLGLGYVVSTRLLHFGSGYYLLFGGLNVIAMAIFNPVGIDGATRTFLRRVRSRVRPANERTHPTPLPSAPREDKARITQGVERPLVATDRALLAIDRLTVAYGAQRAVDEVTMRIAPASVVGLIGPNGAGKTSLIDALTGFVPYGGQVVFDGEVLEGPPHVRCRRGLARTWQSLELFDDLTVRENLLVAAERAALSTVALDLIRPRRQRQFDYVSSAIEFACLADLVDARPRELSTAQQKHVAVARALASGAKLLLLDEPAAGLDIDSSRSLGKRLRSLTEQGISVLVIDHDVDLLLGVCDFVYVLDFGTIVAAGVPKEIRSQEHVVAAYVGRRGGPVEEPLGASQLSAT